MELDCCDELAKVEDVDEGISDPEDDMGMADPDAMGMEAADDMPDGGT